MTILTEKELNFILEQLDSDSKETLITHLNHLSNALMNADNSQTVDILKLSVNLDNPESGFDFLANKEFIKVYLEEICETLVVILFNSGLSKEEVILNVNELLDTRFNDSDKNNPC